jgi:TolB-like protein
MNGKSVKSRKQPAVILLLASLSLPFLGIAGAAVNTDTGNPTSAALRNEPSFSVAVLPVENLSGTPAPLQEIRKRLAEGMKKRGIATLPEAELLRFMARHRMRYAGGITTDLAQAFLKETGTKAVLITSVVSYFEGPPPKLAFFVRLVSTGKEVAVLWIRSVGMSGDDHTGFLGLGRIVDPAKLLRQGVDTALDSMARSVPEGMAKISVQDFIDPEQSGWAKARFRPKRFYRSSELAVGKGGTFTVAVLPFRNIGTRRNAGEVMALHFVSRLANIEHVRVIEPGVVREEMLRRRIIQEDGLSGPQAALLFSMMEADMFVTGNVSAYQDAGGEPDVGFSVLGFEKKNQRVVWSSRSDNRGNDHVLFFDWGEVKTAAVVASEMVREVVERIVGNG